MERTPVFDAGKALELFVAAYELAVSAREKSEAFRKTIHLTLEHLTTGDGAPRPPGRAEVQKLEVACEEQENDPEGGKPRLASSCRLRYQRETSPGFSRRSGWRTYWR